MGRLKKEEWVVRKPKGHLVTSHTLRLEKPFIMMVREYPDGYCTAELSLYEISEESGQDIVDDASLIFGEEIKGLERAKKWISREAKRLFDRASRLADLGGK